MATVVNSPIIGLLQAGGPIVAILLMASVFLLGLVFLKIWQYFRQGIFSRQSQRLAEKSFSHWQQNDYEAVDKLCPEIDKGGVFHLLKTANQHLKQKRLQSKDLVDELTRTGHEILAGMRSHLRIIEVIASLAPLIGLLGTVIGMIDAFQAMEQAGRQVDPSVLSGGIWVALLTTAVGLTVAIPATLAYNWFDRRVETTAETMQDIIARISTMLATETSNASQSIKSDATVKSIQRANA